MFDNILDAPFPEDPEEDSGWRKNKRLVEELLGTIALPMVSGIVGGVVDRISHHPEVFVGHIDKITPLIEVTKGDLIETVCMFMAYHVFHYVGKQAKEFVNPVHLFGLILYMTTYLHMTKIWETMLDITSDSDGQDLYVGLGVGCLMMTMVLLVMRELRKQQYGDKLYR